MIGKGNLKNTIKVNNKITEIGIMNKIKRLFIR